MPERAARGRAGQRFRATVEYDGTEFSGFQIQVGARTVQGELEAALARLTGGNRQPVQGAGRTDAGVHAAGQVIAFTYPGGLSVEALTDALNGTLPPDVAVRDLRAVPEGYNPRYAARYREYRYSIWNGPRSPLRERTALWVRTPLDSAAMAGAASAFEGRHDFSAFGGADPQPVRTVHRLRVRRVGAAIEIDVRADAFLRGMVRRIVATLLAVGKGQLEPAAVPGLLAARTPALRGAAAPARGLCLRRVALGRRQQRTQRTDLGHEE
ncbi:MAG TPA: tRNA pseudouridine(38-40) synthase TruA [Candidatus Limnocylindrales bacterium]|nr:tRNA pseudouridine(38-40) synthase TruA [Candidatus Limnocylindrales bacterium]